MTGLKTAAVIDVHAHVILAETMGAAGKYGPTIGAHANGVPWFQVGDYRLDGVRYVGGPFMDHDKRLEKMDAGGIDVQLLSPNPLTFFHFIEADTALTFCQTYNNGMARAVALHPTRFGALAALPAQDPALAAAELRRAVRDLGFLGGYIGTDFPHPLDDPRMDALYSECVALDVPLFIHPSPAGIDGPKGDPALTRFDLDVVVGFAAQETLAVATLIYGGVLERHPKLDICLSHGGGSTGYLLGRMARAARKRPWSPDWLRADGAFEAQLSRLWFDNHLNSDASLALLTSIIGDDRLVFGTNFSGWDAPDDAASHHPAPKLADTARRLLRVK